MGYLHLAGLIAIIVIGYFSLGLISVYIVHRYDDDEGDIDPKRVSELNNFMFSLWPIIWTLLGIAYLNTLYKENVKKLKFPNLIDYMAKAGEEDRANNLKDKDGTV